MSINDQPKDRRPKWLLRNLALISQRRKDRYGEMPSSVDEWWRQIEAAAAALGLDTKPTDWERWL